MQYTDFSEPVIMMMMMTIIIIIIIIININLLKNLTDEAVLTSTHNLCFGTKIRKKR